MARTKGHKAQRSRNKNHRRINDDNPLADTDDEAEKQRMEDAELFASSGDESESERDDEKPLDELVESHKNKKTMAKAQPKKPSPRNAAALAAKQKKQDEKKRKAAERQARMAEGKAKKQRQREEAEREAADRKAEEAERRHSLPAFDLDKEPHMNDSRELSNEKLQAILCISSQMTNEEHSQLAEEINGKRSVEELQSFVKGKGSLFDKQPFNQSTPAMSSTSTSEASTVKGTDTTSPPEESPIEFNPNAKPALKVAVQKPVSRETKRSIFQQSGKEEREPRESKNIRRSSLNLAEAAKTDENVKNESSVMDASSMPLKLFDRRQAPKRVLFATQGPLSSFSSLMALANAVDFSMNFPSAGVANGGGVIYSKVHGLQYRLDQGQVDKSNLLQSIQQTVNPCISPLYQLRRLPDDQNLYEVATSNPVLVITDRSNGNGFAVAGNFLFYEKEGKAQAVKISLSALCGLSYLTEYEEMVDGKKKTLYEISPDTSAYAIGLNDQWLTEMITRPNNRPIMSQHDASHRNRGRARGNGGRGGYMRGPRHHQHRDYQPREFANSAAEYVPSAPNPPPEFNQFNHYGPGPGY